MGRLIPKERGYDQLVIGGNTKAPKVIGAKELNQTQEALNSKASSINRGKEGFEFGTQPPSFSFAHLGLFQGCRPLEDQLNSSTSSRIYWLQ
jgi:hypothetical protein